MADDLATSGVTHVLSSPYVRCRQSVEPLAERLRLPVDLSDALVVGAPLVETLALFDKFVYESAVLCTHGDVVGELLHHCERQGVHLEHNRLEKGSTWVFETEAGAIVSARYEPPPA
jgi:8-oxo-dGTP diphosphatase